MSIFYIFIYLCILIYKRLKQIFLNVKKYIEIEETHQKLLKVEIAI